MSEKKVTEKVVEEKQVVVVKIEDQVIMATKRNFSTGSRGYYASGKVLVDGKMHQVSMNVVEIGSKGK